ncbi:hypothetical protein C817_02860 [Dorea sp. 5-2]|nr:hypothetical protein C817_02860 [Dorea sp. 5-2]
MSVTLPEHFEDFAEARREGFLKVKELKDSGKNVCGCFCQYTPAEIIRAAGLYQVGLCGKSAAPIKTAETRLPANLCPLIKSSYGHALEQSCPYAYFSDVVVGETTCDGKKKMYELLGELKPMQVIHLPNIPDHERSLQMWVSELRIFAKGLEDKFQTTITEDGLNESIEWCNKERIQAARIYELGRYEPPAITGVRMHDIMEGEQYMFDPQEKYDKINAILDQCEKNWHNGEAPFAPDPKRPRIIVSGTGLGGTAEKTIHVIEELGGAVVCYEGCSGISSRRRLIDEDRSRDPYLRIAEKYIEVPCAVVSPNTRRLEQVAETVREWNADGIVSITLHSCNPFAIETENIRRVCNQMGIPLLHIETDFTPGDEAQIRTRLGAFLEMIRAEKEAAHE